MSPVYIPAHTRATRDLTEFYEKSPEEMSRYELAELEKLLKMTDEEREAWE
jgi:succinate dehydrogenase flavin-adding protein (antitoxin of CptAB toxin-antitoxin module)